MTARASAYPNLREHLHPDLKALPDRRIEAMLSSARLDAEMVEGFLDDLGRIASGVGSTLLKAAPAILPVAGGVIGTAFGGPLGAQVGGMLGQVAGNALGGLTQPAGATSAAPPPAAIPSPPAAAPPAPPVSPIALAGGASPSAAQLLQTILRPETLNALMSMLLGPMGKPQVQVGSSSVPPSAFTNLLGVLANGASAEYNAAAAYASELAPTYMRNYAGEAVGDPALAAHRAGALYELLEQTRLEQEGESAEAYEAISPEALESAEAEAEAEAAVEAWEVFEFIDSFQTA